MAEPLGVQDSQEGEHRVLPDTDVAAEMILIPTDREIRAQDPDLLRTEVVIDLCHIRQDRGPPRGAEDEGIVMETLIDAAALVGAVITATETEVDLEAAAEDIVESGTKRMTNSHWAFGVGRMRMVDRRHSQ